MSVPTGDGPVSNLAVVRFLVPYPSWFSEVILGALQDFGYQNMWDQVGSVTPSQAASLFQDIFGSYRMENNDVGQVTAFACDKMEFINRDPTAGQSQWYPCNGDFLSVVSFPDLFVRIGNTWGGDSTVFGVPDLGGRVILGVGTDPSGAGVIYDIGDTGGEALHQLTVDQLASHGHTDTGHQHGIFTGPDGLAVSPGELPVHLPEITPSLTGSGSAAITNTGSDQPHENRQPFMAAYWYIRVFP